jgi:lysophospholipase L1-like esterase
MSVGGFGMYATAFALVTAAMACRPTGLTIRARDPDVTLEGDFVPLRDGSVRCSWPASQARLRFRGAQLQATIEDQPAADPTPETDRLLISIDRGPAWTLELAGERRDYVLAHDLSETDHEAQLWKQTEAEAGTLVLHSFRVPARAAPVLQRTAAGWLEAVGDSITAGYGALASGPDCARHTPLSSSFDAYTALAAGRLGLHYRAFAFSGKGVLRNFQASDREPLPMIYDRALALDPETDHATRRPPARFVVVNVGTNDFFSGLPERVDFAAALHGLIDRVRARNPEAWLVLALGPMLTDAQPVAGARSQLRECLQAEIERRLHAGDRRLTLIEFWSDPGEGFGCGYHPSRATHARMADELVKLLAALPP